MKKLLLILFVLAICILAFPQGVMAADPQDVIVNAVYKQTDVSFTANPASPWSWELFLDDADENFYDDAIVFTVTSNADWSVSADDKKSGADKGKMTEAASGGGHTLTHYFEIQNTEGTGWSTLEGASAVEIQDSLATVKAFNKDIRQQLHVLDRDYASSVGYTITVVFTCTNGFGG